MPFPRYFYAPLGTPADVDWKRKIKDRKTPARDIGNWSAWSREEGWNDELLVGSTISEPAEHVERLLEDAKMHADVVRDDMPVEETIVERPQPRTTEADKLNDTKSLNRALSRTLYLLVKRADGRWQFPSGVTEGQESLHRVSCFQAKKRDANQLDAGGRTSPYSNRRVEHEYLDRGQCARRPPHVELQCFCGSHRPAVCCWRPCW